MAITRNSSRTKQINFPLLKRKFDSVLTLDALELVCWVFQANMEYVTYKGARVPVSDLYDDPSLHTLSASEVNLQFYGGPPPARWWQGTLLTFLLDLFLQAYMRDDLKKVHAALKVCG